jgi:hypothetical protein
LPNQKSQDRVRGQGQCKFQLDIQQPTSALRDAGTSGTGAQGRIRTFVPRKEEQIYSLPALTTHPPVQKRLALGPSLYSGNPFPAVACGGSSLRQAGKNIEMRENLIPALNTALGKIPYGVLLENLLCRRAAQCS